MIPTYQIDTDKLVSALSNSGLVEASQIPTTTLYGDFVLVDKATGRRMARGEYEDVNRPIGMGTLTGERVPGHIWAEAVALMDECNVALRAREDRLSQEARSRDLARYDTLSERIAQDMDREGSNL